ncbi:hypothetical protein ACVIHI_004137 [Bradyrhizobium sp. USDA 4524]|uniref:hypothetical protein n=1 Tax=unclassified Bradyrhizobium TaxID=2631580 RepID=UPI00209F47C1|nr:MULTISPECIES: hypothetical protein [unclassified Bradyrhizobium]MCP1842943.1 hypothetical protein [Bradyrhizobium sp. USDA 4538]MCP1903508.1 hypothetical protein [Bradyrhizobium sp. USDA 4537]MCP1990835.1 hypothetical protein [Bradyrhizobium sp. USDA 4539]
MKKLHALSVKDRDDPLTEMIAKTIIKVAQSGLRDPAEISAQAIKALEVPVTPGVDVFPRALWNDRLIPIRNEIREPALATMDDKNLQAHSEQALVVVALSTATLIASVALLVSAW